MSDPARKPLLSTGGVLLTATLTTVVYTTPSGLGNSLACVTSMTLANVTGSAATVTLYRVPIGGSAADANAFMKGVSIAANKTYHLAGLEWYLPQGWMIQAGSGTASAIALHLDGWERL